MSSIESARASRDVGILSSAIAAENERPGWNLQAYDFLRSYALTHAKFSSEDVTDAAIASGISPRDGRAWGSIYTKAQRDGVIVRTAETYPRRYGNSTLGLLWRSRIYVLREQQELL